MVREQLLALGYTLHVCKKKWALLQYPRRNEQFNYVNKTIKIFQSHNWPVISVDTKKKELIGKFGRLGKSWYRQAPEVYDHDYSSYAECKMIPFGIYDLNRNMATIIINTSHDTAQLAVDSIRYWWEQNGKTNYPQGSQLLILADSGGSNSYRNSLWKMSLYKELVNKHGLDVTVCHHPPGCSKWNPIEHRVFPFITQSWARQPLVSLTQACTLLEQSSTTKGLAVTTQKFSTAYKTGIKVPKNEFAQIPLIRHEPIPKLNYTLRTLLKIL